MARMILDKVKFGEFVAKRREQISEVRTQALLAKKLKVSKGFIAKIETAESFISFEVFVDLADALLMTPGELMMVLAEREPQTHGYMEMNDWLFGKLLGVVIEYQDLNKTRHMNPEQLAILQAIIQAQYDEADRVADVTPDVEEENSVLEETVTPDKNNFS